MNMALPTLHLIDSQGGGKGKSLLTRVLAHIASIQNHAVQLIDADASKKNIKPFYPSTIEIEISAEQYWGTDIVFSVLEHGLSVVMNLQAGAHVPVRRWFEEDGVLDLKLTPSTVSGQPFELDLEQGEVFPVVKWFLCDATPDSLSDFKQSVRFYDEHYPARINHVLVKNYGLSPDYAWQMVQDTELDDILRRTRIYHIDFPKFLLNECNRLQGLQWDFAKALAKSDQFDTTARQRIGTFVKRSKAAIEGTGLWQDAPVWGDALHPFVQRVSGSASGSASSVVGGLVSGAENGKAGFSEGKVIAPVKASEKVALKVGGDKNGAS